MPVEAIDCPHCYTRVLVAANGICPYCKKDVHDTKAVDLTICRLQVRDGQQFPDYCFQCNSPTKRRVSVSQSNFKRDSLATNAIFLWFFGLFFGLWYQLRKSLSAGQPEITINVALPQCEACASRTPVKVHEVFWDRHEMCFLANRGFHDRLKDST